MIHFAEHEKATREAQKELRAVDDLTLIMRALGSVMLRSRPSIYDFNPDDAAVIVELTERGRQTRRKKR